MPTVSELFSDIVEEVLVIDSSLRTINIPPSVTNLGVESDDETTRLKFQMPRYNDGIDLKDFVVRINYENAGGEGDVYEATDVMANDDTITFSWLVGRFAVMYKGIVKFIVCLKKIDGEGIVDKEFNTTVATLPVLEGLETGEAVIEDYPDAIATTAHEAVLLALGTDLKGDAGYTPVKGVDYFTDEDINELVEEVSNTVKGDYANAYKQTIRGEVIRMDDVSPIEHTVGVKVRGKNLCVLTNPIRNAARLSYDELTQTYTITEAGFVQQVRTFDEPLPIGTKIAVTLQIESGQITGALSFGGYHINADGTNNWQGYASAESGVDLSGKIYTTTFTATDTITDIVLFVDGSAVVNIPIVLKAQFELGDTVTEYEPYINPTTVTLTRCGKNLFDSSKLLLANNWVESNGVYSGYPGALHNLYGPNVGSPILTRFKPLTQYTLSFEAYAEITAERKVGGIFMMYYDDGSHANISIDTSSMSKYRFVSESGKTIASMYVSYGHNVTTYVKNIQFEEGDIVTEYESYMDETYIPAANGAVENVYSVSPTMTLFTDTPGVTIEAEYNKDIQKVINETVTNVGVNLTDTVTGIKYALSVVNGKLTLSETGGI